MRDSGPNVAHQEVMRHTFGRGRAALISVELALTDWAPIRGLLSQKPSNP